MYRASIDGQNVILKISVPNKRDSKSSFDKVEAEGKVYRSTLCGLQGTVVPRSYGFYRGSDARRRKVCCMVMEDCGDPVQFLDKLEDAGK